MPARLTPLETPAPDAIVTGDPRRAFALAGALMEQPKMSHQARGLWGYTGITASGMPLTVQSTGVGAPSAVAVVAGLAELGVRRLVRVGSCVAVPDLRSAGEILLIERAIGRDGVSRAIATDAEAIVPDPELRLLLEGAGWPAAVSSHDFVARRDPRGPEPAPGASARDLQTAGVLALAAGNGLAGGAVLVVAGAGDERDLAEADLNPRMIEAAERVVERLENSRL